MVIFHSYISLPEGSRCHKPIINKSKTIYRSLGITQRLDPKSQIWGGDGGSNHCGSAINHDWGWFIVTYSLEMLRASIKLVMTWGWFMALPHPEWIDDIDDPQHDWIKSCIIHLLTMAHLIHCYDYSIFWHHIQSNPHEFSAVSPVKKKEVFGFVWK